MGHTRRFLALAATASFVFAACSGGGASTAPSSAASAAAPSAAASAPASARAPVRPRSTRSGSSSSGRRRPSSRATSPRSEQGYYEANGTQGRRSLDGGPDVIPQAVGSAADGPEFTISWVPKVLEAREGTPASDLVDIAQVFQRSGTLSVSWKDSNITSPADFKGKKVGVWDFGNEFEVTAGGHEGRPRAGHRLRRRSSSRST